MNSNQVPRNEFKAEFEFDRFVKPVHLSDEKEAGGLFGMRT
jgi:hypothetical protein